MKTITFLFAAIFLFASCAWAELYQWKDEKGVVHLTDSLESVPQRYRENVRVFESSSPERRDEVPDSTVTEQPEEQPQPVPPIPEDGLYGERPEEWWRDAFKTKKEEIDRLSSSIATKENFVDLFEGGRRFGRMFDQEKVDTYHTYKKELPKDRERLDALKAELAKLRKEAAIEDVPREIWK